MSKSTCPESNSVVPPSRDGLVPSSRLASVFSDKQDITRLKANSHSGVRSSIGLVHASLNEALEILSECVHSIKNFLRTG